MHTTEELASTATSLLLAIAAGDPRAATAYDTLLYPLVLAAVRKRGHLLAIQAGTLTGTDGFSLPAVPSCDTEWIANDVTVLALERARARAGTFDPERGDGASWALRQASFAYVDVVRDAYGTRRSMTVTPVPDDELDVGLTRTAAGATPERVVEARAAVDAALGSMPDMQRKVIVLSKQYGFSYSEIAELLFRDPTATKRVDKLLQAARRNLALAQQRWESSTTN